MNTEPKLYKCKLFPSFFYSFLPSKNWHTITKSQYKTGIPDTEQPLIVHIYLQSTDYVLSTLLRALHPYNVIFTIILQDKYYYHFIVMETKTQKVNMLRVINDRSKIETQASLPWNPCSYPLYQIASLRGT